MKKNLWVITITVGIFVWFLWGGSMQARASVIYPLNGDQTVSVSILNRNGNDVTDTWMPVPDEPVTILLNGAAISNVALVGGTTSYDGVCTNVGDDGGADFVLGTVETDSIQLIPKDSGGTAVISINNGAYTFVLPQDDDGDGIPNIFEKQSCGSADCLVAGEDLDVGPQTDSPIGDGFSNFDEYRGWRVAGTYVRGNPYIKDLFIHLEEVVQAPSADSFLDDNGDPIGLSYFYGGDVTPAFANVDTLSPSAVVHRIAKDEWVDNFLSFSTATKVVLSGTTEAELLASAATDRQVNKNAVYAGGRLVKGVRIIQCADLSTLSPLGDSDKAPPDGIEKDNGNAILYVHRIAKVMLNNIDYGLPRDIAYYTYNGRWNLVEERSTPTVVSIDDPSVKWITGVALAWYLAHEALEHSYDVTATVQSTRKASYGYHHAEESGTNVDIKFVTERDKKTSGYTKFYIPKYFSISDQREMRVLTSQTAQ